MTIWIDAQISPSIAAWINRNYPDITAKSVYSLNLREATDKKIFLQAKIENAVIMSKDLDFIYLLRNFGPPPQIIWISTGNTSNLNLCTILQQTLMHAIKFLKAGEPLVEISDSSNK